MDPENFFEQQPHVDTAVNNAYFKERGWKTEPAGCSFSMFPQGRATQRMIWYRTTGAGAGWWEATYLWSGWNNLPRQFKTPQEAFVYAELAGWEW